MLYTCHIFIVSYIYTLYCSVLCAAVCIPCCSVLQCKIYTLNLLCYTHVTYSLCVVYARGMAVCSQIADAMEQGSVLQCATACCSVLQCVAVCCSVLQCTIPVLYLKRYITLLIRCVSHIRYINVVLQCTVYRSVLQCLTVFGSMLQCVVGHFW